MSARAASMSLTPGSRSRVATPSALTPPPLSMSRAGGQEKSRAGALRVALAQRLVHGPVADAGREQVGSEGGRRLDEQEVSLGRELDQQHETGDRRAHRGDE